MPIEVDKEALLARIDNDTRSGDLLAVESACRRLLELAPDESRVWVHLGMALFRQRRFGEAAEALRQAFARNPNDAQTCSTLGVALLHQGRAADGVSYARQAVVLDPSRAAYWANLGACLMEQQQWGDALQAFQAAVEREPANAAMWSNLGAANQRLWRLVDAQTALERSLALAPQSINTIVNYASVLTHRGESQKALTLLQDVLKNHPHYAPAWMAASTATQILGDLPQATAMARRAHELAPRQFEVRYNLAQLLSAQFCLAEAEEAIRSLLAEHGESGDACWLLGTTLAKEGRSEEATEALRRSIDLQPNAIRHSAFLASLQYLDSTTPQSLLAAHRQWASIYGTTRPPTPAGFVRNTSGQPLRLGLVSADLNFHPVSLLSIGALELLDKGKCSIVCYSDRLLEDEYTARYRSAAHLWRTTARLANEEVAELVRADEIDILFDLMGHSGQRLALFDRRSAPMQMTWLGYAGTTGVSAMDYLLADQFHVRDGEEDWYTETVIRMPHGYSCYSPPDYAPDVRSLPALSTGHITFGCFNNPAKYSPRTIDNWAQILRAQPNSRLLLKFHGLDQPSVQHRLRGIFSQSGIDSERLTIEGSSPHPELLAAYNRVDIALDTQPYSGGLTTCEALWMGVPVITCPGPTFAGRHSTSHLTNAGYSQFVAQDTPSYIELAVQWSNQLNELARFRSQMRAQVRQSPLCDAPRFARDFLAILTEARETLSRNNGLQKRTI